MITLCLFTTTETLFILIYVDDTLVTGSSQLLVQGFIKHLSTHFALKDLRPLHYFLGVEVAWLNDNSTHLSHTKYIQDFSLDLQATTNSRDFFSESHF